MLHSRCLYLRPVDIVGRWGGAAPEIDAAMLKWAPRAAAAAAGWCFQLLYLTLLRLLLSNKRDAEPMTGKECVDRGRHTFAVAFRMFVV